MGSWKLKSRTNDRLGHDRDVAEIEIKPMLLASHE